MLTTREVIKTFYNALLQRLKKHRGDWNQNDPSADDYIKNRPFYTDETKKIVNVPEQKITIPSKRPYAAWLILPEPIEFIVGQTHEVKWDDETYSCVAFDLNGISAIGNQGVFGDGTDTGEPFIMTISKAEGFGRVFAPEAIGTHTVEVTTTKVVKLDKKYLPDLGLAPVATSGNYYDLEDAPTVYSDVVRYNGGQNLSGIQKEQARVNIGAISSDEVTGVVKYTAQSLTDTQKQQARTNIGAGTSNFDGAYSSLTGAPSLAAVATSGSYVDLSDAPKLTDIYGENIFTAGEAGGYESVTYKGREYKYVGDLNDTLISKDKKGIVTVGFTSSYAHTIVTYKYKLYRNDYTAAGDGGVLYFSQLISDEILYSFSSTSFKDVDFDVMFAEASKSKRLYMYCSYPYGHKTEEYKPLESTVINESYIPSTIQRIGDPVILSDANGAKWRLTVGTDGALTAEAITE